MGTYPKFKFFILFFVIKMAKLCLWANSTIGCIQRERQALLSFRESFIEDPQHILSSWEGNNCCQWKGVACDASNGHVVRLDLRFVWKPSSVYYYNYWELIDDIDSVSPLEAKELNPSLQELEYLNYLDLSGNNFHGSQIPTFLGSMKHLRYLNLSDVYFHGRVPHVLGNLTKLHALDLGYNDLHTDDLSWVIQLSSLQHLDLGGVNLSKTRNLLEVLDMIPSLSKLILFDCGLSNVHFEIPSAFQNMTVLRVLDLSINNLGSISSWVGKLGRLAHLDLSVNELHGSIPNALQNLTSIRVLDLSDNILNLIPSWIGNLKSLVDLNLERNELEGPIPAAFQNLTFIRFLSVSSNKIASLLPKWMSNLKRLISLDLSYNEFTGTEGTLSTILINSCELKFLHLSGNNFQGEAFGGDYNFSRCMNYDLEMLDLSRNNFTGHLPAWLGRMKKLEYLILRSNSFTGPIPPSLGELLNLRVLALSNNHLNGFIPDGIGRLVNLQVLVLTQNHLQGAIPPSIVQLVNLRALDLSSNTLEGIISQIVAIFQGIIYLRYLDLSNNQIKGVLPENIGNVMPQLKMLRLADNLINDSIPHSLCRWESLYYLDISKNLLSGRIPDCWKDMWIINLSSNKLSGNIPSSLGNISQLVMLNLNNNNLHGEIPVSLKNFEALFTLDLGRNQLFGEIPLWIGENASSLEVLVLQKNRFFGRIPSNLCQLQSLRVLDLGSNHLIGPIPSCFGNLRGMTLEHGISWIADLETQEVKQTLKGTELDYTKNLKFLVNMDLSYNNLVGLIPSSLCSLSGLVGLNLSHNHLSGRIPNNIGDMNSLESLDFSCNQLSGEIPKSMSTLTSLSYLNLSYNNFSGMIPKEKQFLTFNDPSSYAGNPYLCGTPLPECPTGIKDPKSSGYADHREGKEDKHEKLLFYSVIAIGFATGFWGFIGPLILKRSWRHSYFQYVDNIIDRMYVEVVVRAAKMKRWMQRNNGNE